MKTITYNPETHVLVPREPSQDMIDAMPPVEEIGYWAMYEAAIAAAPQPEPVEFRDTCKNNGGTRGECQNESCAYEPKTKPVESEPVGYVDYGDRVEWYRKPIPETDLYTTPQPDRTAELEAALKVARDGIDKFLVANDPTEFGCACDLSVGYLCGPCHADKQQQPLKSALAKINEVLK